MEDTGGAGWRLATARKPLRPTTQGARPPSQHLVGGDDVCHAV